MQYRSWDRCSLHMLHGLDLAALLGSFSTGKAGYHAGVLLNRAARQRQPYKLLQTFVQEP